MYSAKGVPGLLTVMVTWEVAPADEPLPPEVVCWNTSFVNRTVAAARSGLVAGMRVKERVGDTVAVVKP